MARTKLASGDYDLLILDELTYAVKYGWVDVDEVVAGPARPRRRRPTWWSPAGTPRRDHRVADTVTEMVKVKHAYDQGIKAKKGIEY